MNALRQCAIKASNILPTDLTSGAKPGKKKNTTTNKCSKISSSDGMMSLKSVEALGVSFAPDPCWHSH